MLLKHDSINEESIQLAIEYVTKNIKGLYYFFENEEHTNNNIQAIINYFKNANNQSKTLTKIK